MAETYLIEKTNLTHILPVLGQKLVFDLDATKRRSLGPVPATLHVAAG